MSLEEPWLNGRHALITGGSDGIGREIARGLVGICGKLTLVARGQEKLEVTRSELLSINDKTKIDVCSLDVCDTAKMTALVRRIYENGQVDAFINCAGGTHYYGLFESMGHEDIERIAYTNGIAPIHWLKELLPRMKDNPITQGAKQAHVVMMSSRSAERPLAYLSVYAEGKCSVEGLVHSLRQEYARYGIVFTLVNPGSINTSFTSQWNEADRRRHNFSAMTVKEAVYPIIQALNARFAVNSISYESVEQWKTELGVR